MNENVVGKQAKWHEEAWKWKYERVDWCWHSDFIFRDKTRSGLPISGEKLRVFPTPFHGNLPRKLSSWPGESATKRLTRNFAPPFSLDCKQELHSYLPSIVSTRFFVRWNEHITTDILTLATSACMVWSCAIPDTDS